MPALQSGVRISITFVRVLRAATFEPKEPE